MTSEVLKVEMESETCCICGGGGELMTPEEHDAAAPPLQPPLRAVLLQLGGHRGVPDGRLCGSCARRALDAHDLSTALSGRSQPPLSEKIRALRRRLHELTQKIDVFIVVGGQAAGGAGGPYSEDDIIMVDKDALAAAAAADSHDLDHARNAKGDTVYQCSVCPLSFQRMSEYRTHAATHPADARHSCWTCGAQFAARAALRDHRRHHAALHHAVCYLCDTTFQCQSELRRHEATCPSRCPACGLETASRADLARHAAAQHGAQQVVGGTPLVCPACFRTFAAAELLTAHLLRHRQAKQFVCGYGDCVLRFATRNNLMAHIRKAHAAEVPAAAHAATTHQCDSCDRSFGSAAALKRHMRAHERRADAMTDMEAEEQDSELDSQLVEFAAEDGEEVEYLEVETLEDYQDEIEVKPEMH